MRSDEEIERLLEDWLTDEAQPMPHDILESSLESVARTAQTGTRHSAVDWLRRTPMGIVAAVVVLILVVAAGGLALDRIGSWLPTESASAGQPQIWDPAADFRSAPNQVNPGPDSYGNPDVWSYMSSLGTQDPGSYRLLPAFTDGNWNDPRFIFLQVWKDRGGLALHPWEAEASVRYAILGWKSPIAGEVTIRGTVALVDTACEHLGSGVTFSVERESQPMFVSDIPPGGIDDVEVTATVARGESIYFIVAPGIDSNCDWTLLKLTITGVNRNTTSSFTSRVP
jgi:hypothetical protein